MASIEAPISTPSSTPADTTSGARVYTFQEHAPDAVINIQVVDLGRQLFVWLAAGGARLGDLCCGISTPHDPLPAVATLLHTPGAGDASHSLAQRLAKKLGRPVLVSCNLPVNTPLLQVIAEKRLLKELGALQLLAVPTAG